MPGPDGTLAWAEVPDPAGLAAPTRKQVAAMRPFPGGEGIWFDSGIVYFSTKQTDQVWAYETATGRIETIYDRAAAGEAGVLRGVDNLTVTGAGEVFVCEDGGDMEVCVIAPDRTVAPFLQLTGEAAGEQNELAGVVFDPTGTRMYVAAQRAFGSAPSTRSPARSSAPSPGRSRPPRRHRSRPSRQSPPRSRRQSPPSRQSPRLRRR